ncbi:unnamed protein product [Amoebophrya sp. A25]|nr:unnamed protein product [Amoebophrya sp. A25]|eukprot:GSA25T00016192001.1
MISGQTAVLREQDSRPPRMGEVIEPCAAEDKNSCASLGIVEWLRMQSQKSDSNSLLGSLAGFVMSDCGGRNEEAEAEEDIECPVVVNLHEVVADTSMSNSKKIKTWTAEDPVRNIYIGRPSIWGNPFRIGDNGDDREMVVKKYRNYLLHEHPEVLHHLRDLKGKQLGCWCHPYPCHGHVLQELYKEHMRKGTNDDRSCGRTCIG